MGSDALARAARQLASGGGAVFEVRVERGGSVEVVRPSGGRAPAPPGGGPAGPAAGGPRRCADCGEPLPAGKGRPAERCGRCAKARQKRLDYERRARARARGRGGRVESYACADCGLTFPVLEPGHVPKRCPECRARARAAADAVYRAKGTACRSGARPTSKACEACGREFAVKPDGRVPRWCPECRKDRAVQRWAQQRKGRRDGR